MPPASKRIVPLIASSAFGSEKWRMRPSVIVALPENSGCAQRAVDRRGQLGAARAADVAEEALQDAEVRVARRLQRDALVAQADVARDAQPRVLADQLQLVDLHLLSSSAIRIGAAFFTA